MIWNYKCWIHNNYHNEFINKSKICHFTKQHYNLSSQALKCKQRNVILRIIAVDYSMINNGMYIPLIRAIARGIHWQELADTKLKLMLQAHFHWFRMCKPLIPAIARSIQWQELADTKLKLILQTHFHGYRPPLGSRVDTQTVGFPCQPLQLKSKEPLAFPRFLKFKIIVCSISWENVSSHGIGEKKMYMLCENAECYLWFWLVSSLFGQLNTCFMS